MTVVSVLDPYLTDWLDLLLRWLHVIAAIAWIGASFYFVLLDSALRPPKRREDADAGVGGELWEVHGGGFYHVQKYRVAPLELPDQLAWFKWEAYTTWLSGFGLMVLLYYFDARTYLIDPSVADLSTWQAVGISIALLAAAWLVYDLLCRILAGRDVLLWIAITALVALATWGSTELFAARAAFLQVGAMVGTVMAGNVLFNIIPAHWELIRAKEAGREPDPTPGIVAKQRSIHNNYFTLPVLLTMLGGHFAFLYGTNHTWVVLLVLMLVAAWTRLFFNLRHAGRTVWAIPAIGAMALVALALAIRSESEEAAPADQATLARGKLVFQTLGCQDCHTLADAGTTGSVGPNLDTVQPSASVVATVVANGKGSMPGFSGRLTAQEIEAVAAYVESATSG